MSDIQKEKVEEHEQPHIHKIRMTLTSTKVKELEEVSSNIVKNAQASNLVMKGPIRLPTKVLKISTRKTPNGEGSKTWDTYEMRIHKRYIDMQAPAQIAKRITQLAVQPSVDIEVTIAA
ncbi:HHR167Cp [Eremothecium sinecaudum]|uniref:Small ribosomal subunit protein uS10 n=1 Tax=Eremothecium sinecaudum TaxID=45286 RepID=A0A120K2Y0_9SACH|nr:HHR167Cp [Eremothecium sinecaudum]AMD22936.1 HHR167Cp [Eremothecium sinecaudum]